MALNDEISHLRRQARAQSTRTAYAADWADFKSWCLGRGHSALPADSETVAGYLAARGRTLRPASLHRRLCAIGYMHRQAGLPFDARAPVIAETKQRLFRTLGTAPVQKAPLSVEDLRRLVAALPGTPAGLRDRTILLLGFAGAFRRSELAGLDVGDLAFSAAGLTVTLRRAKEDQQARSEQVGIPKGAQPATCPVQAVRHWMVAGRLGPGPLFRRVDMHGNVLAARLSPAAVADVVKRAVARAGRAAGWTRAEVAAQVAAVSGHSLRAGFVTAAAGAGIAEWEIMQQTRHKRVETLRRYIRRGSLFQNNPAGRLGL
ncbi:MAG: hypothetical protein RLY86_2257 [Pseudomonadota bacterium]|jgi:integrase